MAEKVESVEPPSLSLPKNWCWTCLDELGDTTPRNELSDKTIVGFSPMRLVTKKLGEPIAFERKTWGEVRKGFTPFAEGDVVLAKITPCFENGNQESFAECRSFGTGTTELHVFRPVKKCVLPEYVLIFFKSPQFLINGEAHMTGTAGQKRVPWDYFAKTPFPLPPLAEQQRIVAKVDELMRWCDALEARLTAAQTTATHLLDATLAKILSAPKNSPAEEPITFLSSDSIKKEIIALWPERQAEISVEAGRGAHYAAPIELHVSPSPDMLRETHNFFWMFGMTKEFQKAVREIDRKLQGRIFEAINNIAENPVTPRGDTVKPLTGDMKEFWRYRIGDFRLVYLPNREKHQVTLWTFAARGGVYD